MKRIDGPGATGLNQFTNGVPGVTQPTTVMDDWCNNVQEELATLIEAQGITLDGNTYTQLATAITKMIQGSVGASASAFTIANNQSSPANVTGLSFNKATIKSVRIQYDIYRKNNTVNYNETGFIWLVYNALTDDWTISVQSNLDDAGVTFSVTTAGQVQYVSTNISVTSYVGQLRWSNVTVTLQ